MTIALAGRRIDAPGAKTPRFPLNKAGEVREKLKDIFLQLHPSVLVSSAACGTDLLGLEAAAELKIPRAILLPFNQKLFRHTSVTDRPGEWGRLYDKVCSEVLEEKGVTILDYDEEDTETYRRTNFDILNKAIELTNNTGSEKLVAVIVWEGKPKGDDDTTEHFMLEAKKLGFEIITIIIK